MQALVDEKVNAPAPNVRVMAYGPGPFSACEGAAALEQVADLRRSNAVTWVDVEGVSDRPLLERIAHLMGLHALAIDDVAHVTQRAKLETYDDHVFIVLRMIEVDDMNGSEQLSLFLGPGWVITFQEGQPGDVLEPVRRAIRESRPGVCTRSADHLAYSILDAIVDSYFPVVEHLGDQLEELEEALDDDEGNKVLPRLHDIRRNLLVVRRAIWPLREVMHSLLRDESKLISVDTRVYLRDVYDHTIQLVDLVETYRELASSLVELSLTMSTQRLNEVMKVLTVISTIFIPLSFVAGVYGMNFDPDAGPLSMPLLRSPWGYPTVMSFMLLVGGGFLWRFYRRGWLSASPGRTR